jgi:hypothetical protein
MANDKVVTKESLKDLPPTKVVFDSDDLLNNPNSGDQLQPPAYAEGSGEANSAPPTMEQGFAAMVRVAESMEKIVTRDESVRQLSYSEIKPTSPWNPEGKRVRPKFTRNTYLHGILLNPLTHSEEEIHLFNKLKPGRYLDRKVEVQRNNEGEINLQWAGAKNDMRIEMYTQYPSMTLMLRAIIAEREAKEERRRRGQFDDEEEVF